MRGGPPLGTISMDQTVCILAFNTNFLVSTYVRVSVQGVKSLGGHFACLCRSFEFYGVKKKFVIIFQKENGNTSTLLIFL